MDTLWFAIGCLILLIAFLDTFLTVLNYDERGLVGNRIARLQWIVLRMFTRRVSRRWRPLVLRQVTGILIVTTILVWIAGIVLGFAFIYLGLIGLGAFQLSKGVDSDFVGALYLSIGQFSTVGADNISPGGGWVNVIPVLEALSSVVLLSFIIAFLSNVYGVIQLLRSLCADFFRTGPGVGSPTEALQPFFPDGEPRDIDRHLDEMIGDFNLYCDSLRQDHSAYHFQSGDDQFSLPFALYMTSGVVAALRWGLPTGHPATQAPSLVHLTESFDGFRERRYRMMKWESPAAPTPLEPEAFATQLAAFSAGGSRGGLDPWVVRFFALNRAMAETIRTTDPVDVDDAYVRYTEWLPFAHHAQQFVADVGHDLDYQPIYRDISSAPEATPSATERRSARSGAASRRRRTRGLVAWIRRRHLFLDPGNVRLWTALRTLGAVAVAVGIAVPLSIGIGLHPATAGVFAGLIALFAAPSFSGWGVGLMRRTGLLAVLPVALSITIVTFLPRDPVTSVLGLAVVAAAAVWLGRFGPQLASFGQLAFVAYYFALLVAVEKGDLIGALIAATIGVVCSWLSNLLPLPSAPRQIRGGIDAVTERVAVLLDAATDAVAPAGPHGLDKVLAADLAALRRSAASLSGLLDPAAPPEELSVVRVRTLRLRVFDVELAAENLARAIPEPTDYVVTVDERAVLAGELVIVQAHVRDLESPASSSDPPPPATIPVSAPEDWPAGGRHAHAAIRELSAAIDSLHSTARADETALTVTPEPSTPEPSTADAPAAQASTGTAAVDRRAVQAGFSTGLALFLGTFVSTSHQFWAAMPAFQTLSGSDGLTRIKSVQRIVGTVAGAAAAFGLALWTGHNPWVAYPVLAVSVFFMSFLRPVASSWTSFWRTVLLATMYDVLGEFTVEAIDVRVLETIIGAVVAVIVSAVILPTRTRSRVLAGMSDVVTTAMSVTRQALQRLVDPASAAPALAIADAEATMDRQIQQIRLEAEPLRHNPGALQRNGIETQLTSLSALLYYTRHLVKNVAGISSATVRSAQWQQLDGATGDNFAATLAVLDGRLPSRVHDLKDVALTAGAGAGEAERDAILDVERINQTLLDYMASVKPGSTTGVSAR